MTDLATFARELSDALAKEAHKLTGAGAYAEAAGIRLAMAVMWRRLEEVQPPPMEPSE